MAERETLFESRVVRVERTHSDLVEGSYVSAVVRDANSEQGAHSPSLTWIAVWLAREAEQLRARADRIDDAVDALIKRVSDERTGRENG